MDFLEGGLGEGVVEYLADVPVGVDVGANHNLIKSLPNKPTPLILLLIKYQLTPALKPDQKVRLALIKIMIDQIIPILNRTNRRLNNLISQLFGSDGQAIGLLHFLGVYFVILPE